jgi:hypothetical protein
LVDTIKGKNSEVIMSSWKAFALFCLLWISTCPVFAQQTPAQRLKTDPNVALAKPAYWTQQTIRLFKDSPREVTFTMATSWIPGQDHKGMFRYRITGLAKERSAIAQSKANESDTPENTEKFLERVHGCGFIVVLYDGDGFILRRVPIVLQRAMNDDAQLISLNANWSDQMDREEYRSLLGTVEKPGRWDITWDGCQ